MLLGAGLLMLSACGPQAQKESESTVTEKSNSDAVIETIMSRRSIRKYKPEAVNRDTMKIILDCGINAPNGQNKQSWAVRVVDSPEFLNGVSEVFKQKNPQAAGDPNFKNMFRNAPTVVFIGNDTSYDCSQIDCGLLGENMVLAAWSMGIGSCCLASPTRFIADTPEAPHQLYASGAQAVPDSSGRSGNSPKATSCSIASLSAIRTKRLLPNREIPPR